jgi:hypothetical protein
MGIRMYTADEIAELKEQHPKGAPAPTGYVAWFRWAEAQNAHGLKQTQCAVCKLFLFPQEFAGHAQRR